MVLPEILKMTVAVVTHDVHTNGPVLILKEETEGRILPIWIGPYEAYAIMLEMEGVKAPRPMTHDLMADILNALDVKVDRVVINELEGRTFYAQVIIETKAATLTIDSRPSDAIALALRTDSPIFVVREVLEAGGLHESEIRAEDYKTGENLQDILRNIKPSDFEDPKNMH